MLLVLSGSRPLRCYEEQVAMSGLLCRTASLSSRASAQGDEAGLAAVKEAHARDNAALDALLERASAGFRAGETADAVTCRLTMEARS